MTRSASAEVPTDSRPPATREVDAGEVCTSPGNCTAVGTYNDISGQAQAMTTTETDGTFGPATEVTAPPTATAPGAFLDAVSCTSPGNCIAVGDYTDSSGLRAISAIETDGTFAQATEVTAPSNADNSSPDVFLSGVSCPTVSSCTAVGGYADSSDRSQTMEATATDGAFAPATEVTAPSNADSDPGASLNGVSCT